MLELANKEEDEEEEPGDLTGLTTETGFASDERGGGERMETVDRLGLVMSSGKEIFGDVSLQFRTSKLILYMLIQRSPPIVDSKRTKNVVF